VPTIRLLTDCVVVPRKVEGEVGETVVVEVTVVVVEVEVGK